MSTGPRSRPRLVLVVAVTGLAVLGLMSVGAILGGLSYLDRQKAGVPANAHVAECTRFGRSVTCHGTWTVDGQVQSGVVEGAGFGDLGTSVPVTVAEGTAYTPERFVPIAMISVGGVLGILTLAMTWRLLRWLRRPVS